MASSTLLHSGDQGFERRLSVEKLNQMTHGLGLVLSVVGSVVLLSLAAQQEDPWRLTGCLIYVLALTALYAASTLSPNISASTLTNTGAAARVTGWLSAASASGSQSISRRCFV